MSMPAAAMSSAAAVVMSSAAAVVMSNATVAVITCALLSTASAAFAQGGAGAERYEVTISPPKRPGTEEPVVPVDPAAEGAASDAAPVPSAVPDATTKSAAPATAAALAAPAPDAAVSRPATNLPLRTLQVGAYRQRGRAEQLKDALSPTFEPVEIVEVQSGGEPLYRVNVGKLPRGPGLEDLKKRLATAGFPAFEILLPAAPSATR
jgi:cell division protein FtsN